MTTDTALIEKREELKHRLSTGEYKTLVDVFLEWFERLLRKITRRTERLPVWYIAIILILVIEIIFFVAGNITVNGDVNMLGHILNSISSSRGTLGFLIIPSAIAFVVVSLIMLNQYIGRIFVFWNKEILDITDSFENVEGFEDWLNKICNWRLNLIVAICGSLLASIYATPITTRIFGLSFSVPLDYIVSIFGVSLCLLFFYAFVYLVLIFILLSIRLRSYNLRLFTADPSNSEVIDSLSSRLNYLIYFFAIYAACTVGLSILAKILQVTGIILVIVLWIPIIAIFILNQTSLSSIIRRAKWKTLNEIQSQVEEIRASNSLKDKETMEAINRLMDFHDRVKATRNSAIDSSTILNFINSLLLPLLAFLLGNLDKVLPLFSRNL